MKSFPSMARVRQTFPRPVVSDIAATVHDQLRRLKIDDRVHPGQSVAIPVGSRGIANIPEITRAVVRYFRELGAMPFVVPAMGSHGGATADGQREVLASLGVTEASVGAEIRSSMETVVIGTTSQGIPVHFDRHASTAEHVIIMGRIKPHTLFTGDIESGLHKMMLIGLGKHAGASVYHRAITNYSFATIIQAVADQVLSRCRVLAGIGIVENGYDETALIEAVSPAQFVEREKQLLKQAIEWMPRLPFPQVDLLIVDRIGKNISGSGMDTNVIGRKYNDHVAMPGDLVNCKRILVRGLTPESKGNACGIGIAEFTTQRAVDQIDAEYTRVNCITASHPTAGMTPLVYPSDQAAIRDALMTVGMTEPPDARVVQIRDTLHLRELLISEVYLRENAATSLEVLEEAREMAFDAAGNLPDVLLTDEKSDV